MFIVCPQCHFKRTVDAKQIPAASTMATCPKCQNKFRFRDPETGDFLEDICLHYEDETETSTPIADSEIHTAKVESTTKTQEISEEKGTLNSQDSKEDDPPLAHAIIDNTDEKPLSEDDLKNQEVREEDNPLYVAEEMYKGKKETGEMLTDDVPWEHPERYGFFGSFFQTIARVMLRAPAFFSSIHGQTSTIKPMLFYALLGLFQTLALQLWLSTMGEQLGELAPLIQESLQGPMTLILAPFQAIFQLYLYSAFLYLAIRITNPEKADFSLLLRIIAYASAPTILSVVPYIGPLVGLIWFAINIVLGVKYALNLTWQRTILALSPLFIVAFFLFTSLVTGTVGALEGITGSGL